MKKTNAVRILDRNKVTYDVIELEKTEGYGSAIETADRNGLNAAQVFKTLVAVGDKTGVIVAVVAGDRQINLKSLAKVTGNKKVLMLPLKDLISTTGYIRGGCSPLGMKKDFPVILGDSCTHFDRIFINAGKKGYLIDVGVADLVKVCGAQISDIAE